MLENPEKATSMVPTLTTHYGHKALMTMFEAVKKIPSTKSIAAKLEVEQI